MLETSKIGIDRTFYQDLLVVLYETMRAGGHPLKMFHKRKEIMMDFYKMQAVEFANFSCRMFERVTLYA